MLVRQSLWVEAMPILNAKGIKTINLGVGAQNPHGNDEFILYEDLQLASDIAYKLLTKQN